MLYITPFWDCFGLLTFLELELLYNVVILPGGSLWAGKIATISLKTKFCLKTLTVSVPKKPACLFFGFSANWK